jgi:hypothetical protein
MLDLPIPLSAGLLPATGLPPQNSGKQSRIDRSRFSARCDPNICITKVFTRNYIDTLRRITSAGSVEHPSSATLQTPRILHATSPQTQIQKIQKPTSLQQLIQPRRPTRLKHFLYTPLSSISPARKSPTPSSPSTPLTQPRSTKRTKTGSLRSISPQLRETPPLLAPCSNWVLHLI